MRVFARLVAVPAGLLWLVFVCVTWATLSHAESRDDRSLDQVNFAYVKDAGTSSYDVNDQQTWLARIPISLTLPETPTRPTLRILLPITLGMRDFSSFDEKAFKVDRIQLWTFVPGVEVLIPLNEQWTLRPTAQFGVGSNTSGGEFVWIGAVGVGAVLHQPIASFDLFVEPRIRYNVAFSASGRNNDDFIDLMLRYELRRAINVEMGSYRFSPGVYVEGHYFPDQLAFDSLTGDDQHNGGQIEFGVTFGSRPNVRMGFFDLPRVGLGIRFGRRFRGLQLRIGDWAPPPS